MSHPYEAMFNPPAPFFTVQLRNPAGIGPVESLRLLVDSGSDQTIIPTIAAHRLGLISLGRVRIAGFTGQAYLDEYTADLSFDSLAPVRLNVLAAPPGQPGLVGRDFINRYRVVLDGPNQLVDVG